MSDLTKQRLLQLADAKLSDAKFLLTHHRTGNAYYLAGYAIELMLKAVLATRFQADTIPSKELVRDIFTHDLSRLLNLADLRHSLAEKQDLDPQFRARWEIVLEWTETSRYEVADERRATELIEAIDEPQHGVL
jgi:HEPN domain-containing protein